MQVFLSLSERFLCPELQPWLVSVEFLQVFFFFGLVVKSLGSWLAKPQGVREEKQGVRESLI
jgi:hypothetical protein